MDEYSPAQYPLGYSRDEFARLKTQAHMVAPITVGMMQAAGVSPGMRVLDLGSGFGDTALLAAELVGSSGYVLGVDISDTAVRAARARPEVATRANVEFALGDPRELDLGEPFDAIVGRYVLMWHRDPADLVRRTLRHLKADGVVAFHELDWRGLRSEPTCPTFERGAMWITQALLESGADPYMGTKLRSVFKASGLRPHLQVTAVIGGADDRSVREFVDTNLPASLLEVVIQAGLATRDDVAFDTLRQRVLREIEDSDATVIGRSEVTAWARRVPSG